jgi:hypothetical protein
LVKHKLYSKLNLSFLEGEKSIYEGEFADESFATTHDHIGILGILIFKLIVIIMSKIISKEWRRSQGDHILMNVNFM